MELRAQHLGFEDTYGGGDRDYNDMVIGLDVISAARVSGVALAFSLPGITFHYQ